MVYDPLEALGFKGFHVFGKHQNFLKLDAFLAIHPDFVTFWGFSMSFKALWFKAWAVFRFCSMRPALRLYICAFRAYSAGSKRAVICWFSAFLQIYWRNPRAAKVSTRCLYRFSILRFQALWAAFPVSTPFSSALSKYVSYSLSARFVLAWFFFA